MFCKHCGKNPNFEYTLAEWVTYLRGKYKADWEECNSGQSNGNCAGYSFGSPITDIEFPRT